MQWGIKQMWTDGKNLRVSYHRSKDDIQPFAHAQYEAGMSEYIIQQGEPVGVLMLSKDATKVNESQYGIWK
jgi:hypothetical protein